MTAPRTLSDGLRAHAFTGPDQLVARRDDWERLRRAAGLDPLCNGAAWVEAYADAYLAPSELFGWSFERDGRTVGLAALRPEPSRGRLALPRALLASDGSYDSDHLGLPIEPGEERAVFAGLLEVLARTRGEQALVLGPLMVGAPVLSDWIEIAEARGCSPRVEDVPCPELELPDDFDALLAQLAPRMRSKLRQAVRRLEQRGGACAWVEDAAELPSALEDLFALHRARWRSAGGEGVFEDPRRRRFYERLAAEELAAGRLRLARAHLDGRCVAAQFGVEVEGRYYQMQEGYDPEVQDLRTGVALRGWAVRSLIAGGAHAYDFMAGDSRHKRDWGAVPRIDRRFACAVPNRLGLGRLAYRLRRWRDASA